MNNRLALFVCSVLVSVSVSFAGQGFGVLMTDLPEGCDTRLFVNMNCATGYLMAEFLSSNTIPTKGEVICQPCAWMHLGSNGVMSVCFDHDFEEIAHRVVAAKRKANLQAWRLTLEECPAFLAVSSTGVTNAFCSLGGKVLLAGSEADVRDEMRRYDLPGGLKSKVKGSCRVRQSLSFRTSSLGALMGPATQHYLTQAVPMTCGYDEVGRMLGAAEFSSVRSPDYRRETTRVKINVDTSAHAEQLVVAWQARKEQALAWLQRFDEEERAIVDRFCLVADPFSFLLRKTTFARNGKTVELTVELDTAVAGGFLPAVMETITRYQKICQAYRRQQELPAQAKDGESYAAVLARAEAGSSSDMCLLGSWYQGQGKDLPVERDFTKAVQWYRESMAAWNTWGFSKMGECYEQGVGVEKNGRKAYEHYRMAAILGGGHGMMNVGLCYEKGLGVKKDPASALQWFLKAAEVHNNPYGDKSNYRRIASYYEKGIGLPSPDPVEAKKWREKGE